MLTAAQHAQETENDAGISKDSLQQGLLLLLSEVGVLLKS